MLKPKKFVGLHAHSVLSIGDAIGLPQDHINFAIKNGMDGLALTDHGTMAGVSHQYLYASKLKQPFKAIPGVEAYFVDSLDSWRKIYDAEREQKLLEKTAKLAKLPENIGNDMAEAEAELAAALSINSDEDSKGGTVVEDESESKQSKWHNPLYQRNHLVLLPKNSQGLKDLFNLVSESYIDGFYRYPRMDFEMLRKHSKGNIVALSACVFGSALVQTNIGLITLAELVEIVQTKKQEIFILSYSESEKRLKFEKVLNGNLTKKSAKVLKLTLADGKTIKVTPDHKILTDKGWLRADELKKNMPVRIVTTNTQ